MEPQIRPAERCHPFLRTDRFATGVTRRTISDIDLASMRSGLSEGTTPNDVRRFLGALKFFARAMA